MVCCSQAEVAPVQRQVVAVLPRPHPVQQEGPQRRGAGLGHAAVRRPGGHEGLVAGVLEAGLWSVCTRQEAVPQCEAACVVLGCKDASFSQNKINVFQAQLTGKNIPSPPPANHIALFSLVSVLVLCVHVNLDIMSHVV